METTWNGARVNNGAANNEYDPNTGYTTNDLLGLYVENLMIQRKVLRQSLDPRRNVDEECGYPAMGAIDDREYRNFYERHAVAARVVDIFPAESWQSLPRLSETEDLEDDTDFELAWDELGKNISEIGWFEDKENNPIWPELMRADILSGIGHYGAILLGVDDNKELSEPLELIDLQIVMAPVGKNAKVETKTKGSNGASVKLLYIRTLDESTCQIGKLVTDASDPRYGQPEYYNVALDNLGNYSAVISDGDHSVSTQQVHWTRIVHLADNLMTSPIIGAPRMRPVFNELMDLKKVGAGSGEMYWKGAFPGLAFQVDPRVAYQQAVKGNVTFELEQMKDAVENYMNSLQRYMFLPGMQANALSPQVVDPSPWLERTIERICIKLDCPKRIFMGSERGELSSSQDVRTWYGKITGRQRNYVSPRVIAPFVNRLIRARILPIPKQYFIGWPDVSTLTELERADVAAKITDALVKFVQGDLIQLMEPRDYLVRVHKFGEEEVDQILENKMEAMEEELGTDLEAFDASIDTTEEAPVGGKEVAVGGDQQTRLNGAQITAAIQVLESLAQKQIAEVAAVDLLSGIGIAPSRAQIIVEATREIKIEPEAPPQPLQKKEQQEEPDEDLEDGEKGQGDEEDNLEEDTQEQEEEPEENASTKVPSKR